MKHWIAAALMTLCPAAAHAADDLRGETFCFPAKDVPKLIDELAEIKADRRDVVDVRLQPRFLIKDGGAWPERFYLAKDEQVIADIPFSRETGATPSFLESVKMRPDTDICIDDPTRADRPKDDEGLYFEMGLSPLFHNESGRYTLAELQEGAKDGKKFYKKMLPGPVALLMPDTDWFAVKMADRSVQPSFAALTAAGETVLTSESVKGHVGRQPGCDRSSGCDGLVGPWRGV